MKRAVPMTLGQKQRLFVRLLSSLLPYAYGRSWEFTLGDGNRPDRKGHAPNSLHYVRLAQDLNLFIDGVWIDKAHAAWNELGAYWKNLHPLCAWGGDFASRDYNHFSLRHEGRAVGPGGALAGERSCLGARRDSRRVPMRARPSKESAPAAGRTRRPNRSGRG